MLRNMQEASRMINFLTAHGLTSPDDLNDRAVHEAGRGPECHSAEARPDIG